MGHDTHEQWLACPGYPGYEVSDQGQVRSLRRTVVYKDGRVAHFRGRVLKQWVGRGRMHVRLPGRGVVRVHVLVLEAFVGPRPAGHHACHNNDIPSDNRLSNLRWDTSSENQRDRVRLGTHYLSNRGNCPRGHLLEAPNLVPSRLRVGQRTCLSCNRAGNVVRKARAKGLELDWDALSDTYYAELSRGGERAS